MTRGRPGRGARVAGALARRRGRPAAAPAAGRGVVAGAQRTPRGGQPLHRAHPRPARRRRCAALRMRADPERGGGVSPTTRTVSPRCTIPGPSDPPLTDPLLLQVHANRSAFRTLLDGEPALARLRQQQAPRGEQRRGAGLPRPLGRLHRRPGLPVGRPGAAGREAAAPDAGARRSRPRPAQPVRLHAGGAARRRAVGAQRARRGGRAAGQPARRAGAQRPARGGAAGLPHDGAHRSGRGRRAPRARAAGRAGRRRRGAPPAAPAHRQPGRAGAAACAPLPARDLPRPVRAASTRCWPTPAAPQGPLWRRSVAVLREVAFGHAAIAAQDWRRAAESLAQADALARRASSSAACTSSCWACAPGCSTAAARSRCRCCARRSTWPPPTAWCASSTMRTRRWATGCARRCRAARRRRPAPLAGSAAPRRSARRRPAPGALDAEHGADAEGARGAGTAGAQPLQQGDRPGDAGGRRDHQVAHEEPVRQARCGHAQAGGAAGAHPGAARSRDAEATGLRPHPLHDGGNRAAPVPNLAVEKGRPGAAQHGDSP